MSKHRYQLGIVGAERQRGGRAKPGPRAEAPRRARERRYRIDRAGPREREEGEKQKIFARDTAALLLDGNREA